MLSIFDGAADALTGIIWLGLNCIETGHQPAKYKAYDFEYNGDILGAHNYISFHRRFNRSHLLNSLQYCLK